MPKLLKIITLIITSLMLSACIHLYRPNIQQGNVVTTEMLSQLKVGMTQEQVRYLLGTPILANTFDPNRWQYAYTYKQGGKPMVKQAVSLQFSNGILQNIDSTPLVSLPNPNK